VWGQEHGATRRSLREDGLPWCQRADSRRERTQSNNKATIHAGRLLRGHQHLRMMLKSECLLTGNPVSFGSSYAARRNAMNSYIALMVETIRLQLQIASLASVVLRFKSIRCRMLAIRHISVDQSPQGGQSTVHARPSHRRDMLTYKQRPYIQCHLVTETDIIIV